MSNLSEKRRTRISKAMSYLLRHHPEKGDLQPDPEGYVPVDDLVEALRTLGREVSGQDVREVVQQDPKGRYEIRGAMIRATYGHSFDITESGEECVPPDTLYHGTPRRSVEAIMQAGLRPMQRQWVHLSATVEEARKVGQRRDSQPAILAIDAQTAHEDGINFRKAGSVYLSPEIPPQYIEIFRST